MSNKIGRNDACPCGSGKKYKHCHLKENAPALKPSFSETSSLSPFDVFVNTFDTLPVLGLLSALQLHPANQGRLYRLEQLCLATLRQFNLANERPLASWEQSKAVIENYTDGAMMEDPLSSAFTEVVIFEGKNYLVYPGMYDGFTGVLNHLNECIFQHVHTLHPDFKAAVRSAVGLLLYMSNRAAEKAGHSAFLFQENDFGNIEFPEYEKTMQYVHAVYFKKAELKEIRSFYKYDFNILNNFLLQPGSVALDEEDPDKIVVNFRPLIVVEDEILLYMPSGVLNALISFIYRQAKDYNCYNELMELMYNWQFHLACMSLNKIGWSDTDIELPAAKMHLATKEAMFQFDNQKAAYVCYVKTGQPDFEEEENKGTKVFDNPYGERAKEIVKYLNNIDSRQPFEVFCLYIIGEVGSDFYFSWNKPAAGNLSLALKFQELRTITHSPKVNALTLWKFAKCYSRTHELTRVMTTGGVMDAYAIYQGNHGSLLHSDAANPIGGMLMIANGSSDAFRRDMQKQQNEHALPMYNEQGLVYAKVFRFKDYAPIYVEEEISNHFRLVIECFKTPIWISSRQTRNGGQSWASYTCEAVAFWLNKTEPLLAPYLDERWIYAFEIEIVADKKLFKTDEFDVEDIEENEVTLKVELIAPRIRISIPFAYANLVIKPDNRADKLLMKHVLQGIADCVITLGKTTTLNTVIIADIVEKVLQPGGAKMILMNSVSDNILLDGRNLPAIHYLSDTDVSYILDNLVSYLPEGYTIPSDIPDKSERIRLCNDIVVALTKQLAVRLKEFDGAKLLEWLIKMNEACVHVREMRELHIPARIACYSDFQTEVDELMDDEENLVTTALAVRVLIEFVATNIPRGSKWPNFDDMDELLAFTDQIMGWGTLSDAIQMGIDDPKMGLLPSGRIGVDKTVERESFLPYAIDKTECTIFRQMEDVKSTYAPVERADEVKESKQLKLLDTAFKAEFNISVSLLTKIIRLLVNEGFTTTAPCIKIEATELESLLMKVEDITDEDIETVLQLLTLVERPGIGIPPPEYKNIDIFPWRYGRALSYLRRPLVKVVADDSILYYFGYRHLVQFADNLNYLLHSGKLPNSKSGEMRSWLAGILGKKGNPFRKEAKNWFKENSELEVIEYEVQMSKKGRQGHLASDESLGDIDLFVIDHQQKIIYPIECKNMQGGRNVHEMKIERDEFLGRNADDRGAKMRKHANRDKWLNENKKSLKAFIPNAENYTIKSFILTADTVALAYRKNDRQSLPIKSFSFLKMKGLSYLKDL